MDKIKEAITEEEKIILELKKNSFEHLSGFERFLVNTISMADPNNMKKLRKAYPKLVTYIQSKGGNMGLVSIT